jgi:DNA-binding transcriptional MerR regulator
VVEKSPDAFRTISEAAEELGLPQHVLRFWETRFSTIRPLKRGGGRRYYRPEDVMLLKGIRHLLYDRGFTIKGVQRILKTQGSRYVVAIADGAPLEQLVPVFPPDGAMTQSYADPPETVSDPPPPPPPDTAESTSAPAMVEVVPAPGLSRPTGGSRLDAGDRKRLESVLKELLDCKRLLERARET